MHTEFVHVYRVEHGDYMFIPKSVWEQYPDRFTIVEDENTEELNVVKVTKGRKTKK